MVLDSLRLRFTLVIRTDPPTISILLRGLDRIKAEIKQPANNYTLLLPMTQVFPPHLRDLFLQLNWPQRIPSRCLGSFPSNISLAHLLHLEFGTSLIASSYKIRFRIVSRFYPLWSNMSTVFSIGSASVVTQRRRH